MAHVPLRKMSRRPKIYMNVNDTQPDLWLHAHKFQSVAIVCSNRLARVMQDFNPLKGESNENNTNKYI
jgi:hypothetical protein